MDLTLSKPLVHDAADIVRRYVAQQIDRAGFGIDLDFGDMAAIGEGGHGGVRR